MVLAEILGTVNSSENIGVSIEMLIFSSTKILSRVLTKMST